MISCEELAALSRASIKVGGEPKPVDISAVKISGHLPADQRLEQTIEQLGNPYCFSSEAIIVKMEFAATAKTLEQTLTDYFMARKTGGI